MEATVSDTDASTATVCVVGLGYVGLPLATAFDERGYGVIGFDVDAEKVAALGRGVDPIEEVGDENVRDSDVAFTAEPRQIASADVVLIAVPTPVDNGQNPDLQFVKSAARTVGEHLTEGTTVVLESTVYPGVTREVMTPLLEEASGLEVGAGFDVGYSPERLSPGDTGRGIGDVVKIVSGNTDETLAELAALYESVVDAGVYRAPSIETAEAAKVLENVQRDLNIALVNELAVICDNMGLDTHEVLEAAGSKWNFHEYTPGLVGGHCIPVDPHYLVHGSERAGFSPKLIIQAREINDYMPKHAAELTVKALNDCENVLRRSRVLVAGLAYKPNVGDVRTSEIGGLIDALEEFGIEVVGHDPLVDDAIVRDAFGVEPVADLRVENVDGIVLATPHDVILEADPATAIREADCDLAVVDLKGVLDRDELPDDRVAYRRL